MGTNVARRRREIAAACVSGLLAAACASPGATVADRIRAAKSPIVREVVFDHGNILDPPEVTVYLRPGATEAQAEQLWCEVIEPAGGSHLEGDGSTLVLDDSGWTAMASDTVCGSPSPGLSPAQTNSQ